MEKDPRIPWHIEDVIGPFYLHAVVYLIGKRVAIDFALREMTSAGFFRLRKKGSTVFWSGGGMLVEMWRFCGQVLV